MKPEEKILLLHNNMSPEEKLLIEQRMRLSHILRPYVSVDDVSASDDDFIEAVYFRFKRGSK